MSGKTGAFFMFKGRVGKGVYHNTSKNGTPVTNFNLGLTTGQTPDGKYKWESCSMTAWKDIDVRTGAYVCVTGTIRSQKVGDKYFPMLVVDTCAVIDDSKAEASTRKDDPENFYRGDDNPSGGMPTDSDIPF